MNIFVFFHASIKPASVAQGGAQAKKQATQHTKCSLGKALVPKDASFKKNASSSGSNERHHFIRKQISLC